MTQIYLRMIFKICMSFLIKDSLKIFTENGITKKMMTNKWSNDIAN